MTDFLLPVYRLLPVLLLCATFALPGCDLIDPTEVENPRTTIDDLADAPRPTQALLPGLRAAFADALGDVVTLSAAVSDDYSIHNSGLSQDLDFPRQIGPDDASLNTTGGAYFNLQELRSLTDFVIDDIFPGDEEATPAQVAEVYYYRGMAFLLLGENFVAAPVEEDGAPVPAGDLLRRALDEFQQSLDVTETGPFVLAAEAAIARTHRALGEAAAAADFAQRALDRDDEFLFVRAYDPATVTNPPYTFLVARSLQELQPLPRLDFLDPKYISFDAGIPVAKAEEMLLILAEVGLANGSLSEAQALMVEAATLARSGAGDRGFVTFEETDVRNGAGGLIRPRDAVIRVRADAESPFIEGLVLQRPGTIEVPVGSYTSLSADSVAAVPASQPELGRLLYTLRQEILFLEGRRMHDLGIRLPMMQREIDTNPTIQPGDLGTEVFVPAYVPADNTIDLFNPPSPYDEREQLETEEVTILVDMNRVLATERGTVVANPLLGF